MVYGEVRLRGIISRVLRLSGFAIFACISFYSTQLIASGLSTAEKPPLLIYNQFPRIWNMDFNEMQKHLKNINSLGFNAIWVNPFMKTSKHNVVSRKDKRTGGSVKVIRSLYGMFDPSLIDTEVYTEASRGDPLDPGKKVDEITSFTKAAKDCGLVPMFDLVLNHVSRDSPLVAGTFDHFLKSGVDTSKWFVQTTDCKWNDIVPFDYEKTGNIDEIFNYLWKPFIEKMVKFYGFTGVRIDFATGPKVNAQIIKKCIDHIKSLIPEAVIFAEDLFPGAREARITHVLSKSKDVGFSHVTNIAMYLPRGSIGNKVLYEPFLENLGLKKLMTQAANTTAVRYRSGTIGFPGSHDEGTALQVGGIPEHASPELKLSLAKERMAIAAFSSDAGWYLLSGDEVLSITTKSPFVRQDGSSFAGGTDLAALQNIDIKSPLCIFIQNINKIFTQLRSAPKVFWVEMFFSEDKKLMYFVRHLGEGETTPTDIVTVRLSADEAFPSDLHTMKYLKEKCNAKISAGDIRFFTVG